MSAENQNLREAIKRLLKAHRITFQAPPKTITEGEKQIAEIEQAVKFAEQALAHPADCGEVVAYEVWWGLSNMRPLEQPSRTYDEAKLRASQIKSHTEIRPLYRATPPANQEQTQSTTRCQATTTH